MFKRVQINDLLEVKKKTTFCVQTLHFYHIGWTKKNLYTNKKVKAKPVIKRLLKV